MSDFEQSPSWMLDVMHCHSSCSWSYRLVSVSSRNHLVRRWLNVNSWQALILSLEVRFCIPECYHSFSSFYAVLYAVGIVELELESTSALILLLFVIPLAFTLSGFLLWIMYALNGLSFPLVTKNFVVQSLMFAQEQLHNSLLGSNVINWQCSGDCTASFSWRWLSLLYSLSYLRCRFPIDLRKVRAIGYS